MEDEFYALTSELEVETFHFCSYSDLMDYVRILDNAIVNLREVKELYVLNGLDERAVEIQKQQYYAMTNKTNLLTVMMSKEADTCQFGSMETMWLN